MKPKLWPVLGREVTQHRPEGLLPARNQTGRTSRASQASDAGSIPIARSRKRKFHVDSAALTHQTCLHLRPQGWGWSEPLKWHTELGTVSGKGKDSEEKAILPEISADGRRTHENLRTGR